jgi:plasmid maintenance system antidote protein VapI
MSKHPLQTWLEDAEKTQAELAALADTQQPRISTFLSGESEFGSRLAGRIRDVTGLSLDDLLFNTPKAALRRAAEQEARKKSKKTKARRAGAAR